MTAHTTTASAQTWYQILGIAPEATAEQIKRAYRLRARQTHPDAGGTSVDFCSVRTAFEVLSSPLLRREYDATLIAGATSRETGSCDQSGTTAQPAGSGNSFTGPDWSTVFAPNFSTPAYTPPAWMTAAMANGTRRPSVSRGLTRWAWCCLLALGVLAVVNVACVASASQGVTVAELRPGFLIVQQDLFLTLLSAGGHSLLAAIVSVSVLVAAAGIGIATRGFTATTHAWLLALVIAAGAVAAVPLAVLAALVIVNLVIWLVIALIVVLAIVLLVAVLLSAAAGS